MVSDQSQWLSATYDRVFLGVVSSQTGASKSAVVFVRSSVNVATEKSQLHFVSILERGRHPEAALTEAFVCLFQLPYFTSLTVTVPFPLIN